VIAAAQSMLAYDFMRNALLAGSCIALASGLVGYFVVLRNQVFTTDALGHVAFTGGLGALLVGLDLLAGVFGSCIAVALLMGSLGGRGRGRDVTIGTVFAWVLGVGVLFLSLYTSAAGSNTSVVGISLLFGSIFGLQSQQTLVASVVGLAASAGLLVLARPVLFIRLDPEVAVSRGVPVRTVAALFMILVAVTVAEAVQAVGALLVFGLMVTPAAIAQSLTTRPYLAMALSGGIAIAAVFLGLTLAFWLPYPASFFITSLAFAGYLATRLAGGLKPKKPTSRAPAASS
jgi:zinc/manganese transport system permease protein